MSDDTRPTCPTNFRQIISDFTNDLTTVFPEYSNLWIKWSCDSLSRLSENELSLEMSYLFEYCVTIFPERFFDILYQNNDIFMSESLTTANTCFLPNVDFKLLYNTDGVSENTKKTMWKYLQLICFTIVGTIQDKSKFGESMNMFDGIDEAELHTKLNDTISGISDFFQNVDMDKLGEHDTTSDETEPKMAGSAFFENSDGIPNPDDIHSHIKGLFDGKIGNLAKEMAEDISKDLSGLFENGGENIGSTKDVLKALMKDPKKITNLIKTVGDKLNTKISSGEISQAELMKEAGDLIGKMKGMKGMTGKDGDANPMGDFMNMFKNMAGKGNGSDDTNPLAGMGDLMSMFSKMTGKGDDANPMGDLMGMFKGMGGKGKLDTNAMNRVAKAQSTKERLRNKMLMKQAEAMLKQQQQQQQHQQQQITNASIVNNVEPSPDAKFSLVQTDKQDNYVFKLDDDEVQMTSSKPTPTTSTSTSTNKKKKKGKK